MSLYLESLGQSLRKQWPKGNCYWKIYPNIVNPYFTLLLCKQCSHEGSGVHKLKKKYSNILSRAPVKLESKNIKLLYLFLG